MLQSRRELLTGVVSAATLLAASPAFAAYGDSANVFGRKTNSSGFIPYAGDGFTLELPSKWIPSPEREFPGTVFRSEPAEVLTRHHIFRSVVVLCRELTVMGWAFCLDTATRVVK